MARLGELGEPAVRLAGGRAGDDERGAGLVDEDRVDLVDDGVVVAALHHVGGLPGHVVAQVVEAELVVRAVGDVGGVLLAALGGGLAGDDASGRHPERAEDAAHQLGLVAGEVVVDRDDVHAAGGDRVEVGGQGGDEGLALTGLHLGDVAEVQGRAAHQLHVEGRMPRVRLEASRTAANASGSRSSSDSPFEYRSRSSTVSFFSSSSVSVLEVVFEFVHGLRHSGSAGEGCALRRPEEPVQEHWPPITPNCRRRHCRRPEHGTALRSAQESTDPMSADNCSNPNW